MVSSKIKIALLAAWLVLSFGDKAAAEINVVTSIKPLHALAAAIMQGVGEPKLLMRSNVSPHDYKLKPSDIRLLNAADIILWLGPILESRLAKPIRRRAKTTKIIELLKLKELVFLPARTGGQDHQEGTLDPHIWLSLENARRISAVIAGALAQKDPKNADIYATNLNRQNKTLTTLEATLRSALATVSKTPFLMHHDAFQYFEKDFNLNGHGAIVAAQESRLGAKRVIFLRHLIRQKNIKCVFSEPQYNQKILHAITKGLAAKIATLDAIGTTLPAGPDLYPKLLRNITFSLHQCLGGN